MKRCAINFLTGVSFALLLAVCAEWTRSHYISDLVESARFARDGNRIHRRILTFWSGEGSVACNFFFATEDLPSDGAEQEWASLMGYPQGVHWQEVLPPRHPARAHRRAFPSRPASS